MTSLRIPEIKICFSTRSIWFDATIVCAFGLILIWLIKFSWSFSIRHLKTPLLLTNTNKRKKRSSRKKKPSQINTNEVSIVDESQPNKDTKDCNENSIRKFSLKSLADATQDFSSDCLMHSDGLGQCFRGQMTDTDEVFVIRGLKIVILSTLEEFINEVFLLTQAHHPNLAKLIGYSADKGCQRLLVYEYIPGGSLENRLRGNQICLDWKKRMKIALGVARALEYLQTVMDPSILHCYLQPSNILLDEEDTPKLYCSGVIRMYPSRDRVSMPYEMIGSYTHGLRDYRLKNEVTLQTDIYGFGILLLEMITAKAGIFFTEDGTRQLLNEWVQPYFKDDIDLTEMVDPRLQGKVDNEELYEVCNIAKDCIEEQPSDRPLIANLVTRMNQLVG